MATKGVELSHLEWRKNDKKQIPSKDGFREVLAGVFFPKTLGFACVYLLRLVHFVWWFYQWFQCSQIGSDWLLWAF